MKIGQLHGKRDFGVSYSEDAEGALVFDVVIALLAFSRVNKNFFLERLEEERGQDCPQTKRERRFRGLCRQVIL